MTADIIYKTSPIKGLEILSCTSDRNFGNHLHEGFVIWLNSAGGEHYSLKKTQDVLQPGSISIIEPGVIHSNRPFPGSSRHLRSFYVSLELVQDSFDKLEKPSNRSLQGNVVVNTPLWTKLTQFHHHALFVDHNELAIECDWLELFSHLVRPDDTPRTGGDNRRLQQVVEYLRENLHRKIRLSTLANRVLCTEYHLIRIFKNQFGIPPHAFLIQLRIEAARKALAAGTSICDTAFQTGFSDQSHLTRCFSKRYGVTPATYQKQLGLRS